MRKKQSTHSFASAMFRNTGRRLLLGAACAMLSIAASAQTYPSFTAGGETDLRTDVTPTIAYLSSGEPAMVYRDSRTGNVAVSLSADGVTWSSPVDTGVPTDHPIAAANDALGDLYIVVYTGGAYHYITSTDGVTFTPPQPLALSIGGRTLRPRFQPSLVFYDTNMYLSVVDAAPGSPDAVDVLVAPYGVPSSFSSFSWLSDIPTSSGSSLAVFTVPGSRFEALALVYTTGPEKHPVLRTWLDFDNNQGYPDNFSSVTDTAVRMAGTPQIVLFSPPGFTADVNMYIFGRSVGEEHHLLAVDYEWPNYEPATFLPPQRYEQTLSRSPAVGYAGTQLLVAFRSKDGNKIQSYTAPYGGRQ
ncbi:MAG TPA: hypothetical protein VGM02_16975 [Acidobacteriaceae bacterium]